MAMNQEQLKLENKRGLRFPFEAEAEVVVQGASNGVPARVTELSFRGCFLETSAPLQQQQRVHVKIFHSDQYFEALANVIYVRPTGVGLLFGDIQPHFRAILQAWILSALDNQEKSKRP